MLTLFTTPKPFRGHIAVIQRNAIQSWCELRPSCEIILFGDEEGSSEIVGELGLRHVRDLERNEYGTPLLNTMFEVAQEIAAHPRLCYVNADIVLLSDFPTAVRRIPFPDFLMVGQRWDVDLAQPLDVSRSDWEPKMRQYVRDRGILHTHFAMDFFVFPRGLFTEMPPFAVGRPAWDNWMVYRARSLKIPVVDATAVVMAIHQNHGYDHPRGRSGIYRGTEGMRNLALAGGLAHAFDVRDATHVLTPASVKRALRKDHLKRRLDTLPVLHPRLGPILWPRKAWGLLKRICQKAMRGS